MKTTLFFLIFFGGRIIFTGDQVYIVPVVQEGMKVHLMADHDSNHIITDMTIWGGGGNLGLIAALGNNHSLLSDFLDTPVSCYKIEAQQEIGVVLEYESTEGDINLVALRNGPHIQGFIVPHMGMTPGWQNRLAFGADMDNIFSVEMGDLQTDSIGYNNMSAETYHFHPFQVNKGKGFCTVMGQNQGFYGGAFFEFTRADGIRGSSAVSPMLFRSGDPGYTTLFLIHVAKDTGHFWTGYSLLNIGGEMAVVGMTAWKDGQAIAYEEVNIRYREQDIAVIGTDRFASLDPSDIDWIEITSSSPILGLELFGSPSNQNSYLAGFELPHQQMRSQKLLFPAVSTEPFRWTGLCILNPSPDEAYVSISFIGDQMDDPNTLLAENVVGFTSITLPKGQKWIAELTSLTTPYILEQTRAISILSDQGVLGFALIGDYDRQQLGGYLGIPAPTSL